MKHNPQRPKGGNQIPEGWLMEHNERTQQRIFESDTRRFLERELGG